MREFKKRKKVYMFVMNNCKNDSRVLKEAKSLTDAGYDVRIIAVLDKNSKPFEQRNGFRIIRVSKNLIDFKNLNRAFSRLPIKILELLIPFNWSKGAEKRGGRAARIPLVVTLKNLRIEIRKFSKPIRQKGLIRYVKGNLKKRPLRFFTVGWVFILGYYLGKYLVLIFLRLPKKILIKSIKLLLRPIYIVFPPYTYRALKLIKAAPADIYHANDLNTLPTGFLAKLLYGGKLVYDSHELYLERSTLKRKSRLNEFILRGLESRLIKKTQANITVNDSIARELRKRYKIKKPTVVMNAPHTNSVTRSNLIRQKMGLRRGEKIVLYSGGITFNRGLEELINSLLYLKGVTLVIMGFGNRDYVSELKKIIKQHKLSKKVLFFKAVPPTEVTKYASSADVGAIATLNTSLNNYYTTPNKLFEYINAGLPVVASNFPELKKIVEGYNFGRTFNPDNPKDIAKAISEVLSNKKRYETMKDNTLEAAKIFNWENEEKKFLDIYKKLS